MATKIETLIANARREYAADLANAAGTPAAALPFSPARATNATAKKYAYPKSRLIPIVAEVYYEENGNRFPLPKSAAKSPAGFRAAVLARRNRRGRLGRWDVIAYSATATLGTPVSVAAVRAAFREAGGVEATSYTGRGTRRGAPDTRESETAEIDATLS